MNVPGSANPLLLGLSGGYQISRSVRLRSSASAYLNRTQASSLTSTYKWTYSAWIKRGTLGVIQYILNGPSGANGNYIAQCYFNSDDTIILYEPTSSFGGGNGGYFKTNQVFRDPSSWYHIVIAEDATSPFIKLYVNGVQVTSFSTYTAPTTNVATKFNVASSGQFIGAYYNGANNFDGYLAEVNFIDGQALTPSSFGSTNTTTGVWQPIKYSGTYGTNGFYLNFSNNASTTTLGYDTSGNGNNWTANNISLTAGVTYDSMIDTPTPYADGGNGRGNYAVMNPIGKVGVMTLSNGNLTLTGGSDAAQTPSTIGMVSGKWYYEHTITAIGGDQSVGIGTGLNSASSAYIGSIAGQYGYYNNGNKYTNGSGSAYGASYTTGDVIGVAYDADAGSLTFYKNGTSQGVAFTGITGTLFALAESRTTGGTNISDFNFGQRPFTYTPPTGFNALNTQNLPTPTIKAGNKYFDATTWTGNGTSQSITNAGAFQPDFVWIKSRSGAYNNYNYDSVRGVLKEIYSNLTNAEYSNTVGLSAFNSNGFSVNSGDNAWNANAVTYVGWQWKAGGTSSSNTNGSITSQVSANPTAGFSVVTFTGTGAAGITVGHGLGVVPAMLIVKSRGTTGNWLVYHKSLGNTGGVALEQTSAFSANAGYWNNTSPTSSVFTLGTYTPASTAVAYLFAEVAGFSKFGSYTGNGSADGPFVYLGFRPKFVMIKVSSGTIGDWELYDTSRDTYNASSKEIWANSSNAERSVIPIDILSNGFKPRDSSSNTNGNGFTYIYACFAEVPFRYANAR